MLSCCLLATELSWNWRVEDGRIKCLKQWSEGPSTLIIFQNIFLTIYMQKYNILTYTQSFKQPISVYIYNTPIHKHTVHRHNHTSHKPYTHTTPHRHNHAYHMYIRTQSHQTNHIHAPHHSDIITQNTCTTHTITHHTYIHIL